MCLITLLHVSNLGVVSIVNVVFILHFYSRCPEGIGRHNVKMSWCLIGQKSECYIVEEVIKVDEPDKGNISAALGKQDK